MIEIDTILGCKYESPWREEMICTSGSQVLIVAKSVLAVLVVMAWSLQLQLDDGGENR
jgi:hypothetical protein